MQDYAGTLLSKPVMMYNVLSIGRLDTNFGEILIKISSFIQENALQNAFKNITSLS